MRGLPRIIVDYEPLPEHTSYQGKHIATRTESHYACLDQPRDELFKDTYERCKIAICPFVFLKFPFLQAS